MKLYFFASRSAYYSAIASIPLLLIYDILLTFTSPPQWQIRNAADVWLRQLMEAFEISSSHATFAMLAFLFATILFSYSSRSQIRWPYFAYILGESLVYSFLLGFIIQAVMHPLFSANPMVESSFFQRVALSLGAGLFEEFFFRVLLWNGLWYTLKFFTNHQGVSAFFSIGIASFLFSASHYIGPLGEVFQWYSFIFRFVAGLLFTLLYFLRGFAVTAYTHALYDVWLLL